MIQFTVVLGMVVHKFGSIMTSVVFLCPFGVLLFLFLFCFIQLHLCFVLFAGVFLSYSAFDLSGPPYGLTQKSLLHSHQETRDMQRWEKISLSPIVFVMQ